MSRIFGPIDQVAWVVPDITASMLYWAEKLGVGPWHVIERLRPTDFRVDGVSSAAEISLAFAYSGRLQLELIQPHDDEPSMYKEAIDAGRAGAQHHVGFFRRDFDRRLEAALDAGYEVGQSGSLGAIRFAYLRTDRDPGTIAELVELSDGVEASFVAFHRAALEWDGSVPVRRVG